MYPIAATRVTILLREASTAHHEAEQYLPQHDWEDWYGAFIAARLNTKLDVREAAEFADNAVRLKLLRAEDDARSNRKAG